MLGILFQISEILHWCWLIVAGRRARRLLLYSLCARWSLLNSVWVRRPFFLIVCTRNQFLLFLTSCFNSLLFLVAGEINSRNMSKNCPLIARYKSKFRHLAGVSIAKFFNRSCEKNICEFRQLVAEKSLNSSLWLHENARKFCQ